MGNSDSYSYTVLIMNPGNNIYERVLSDIQRTVGSHVNAFSVYLSNPSFYIAVTCGQNCLVKEMVTCYIVLFCILFAF